MTYIFVRLIGLILLLTITTNASSETHVARHSGRGKLIGQVLDAEESAPIGRAFIILYREEDQGQNLVRVDSQGKFELDLEPGFYDVLAGAVEFVPTCERFAIISGKLSKFEPKLKADAEHLEQHSAPK